MDFTNVQCFENDKIFTYQFQSEGYEKSRNLLTFIDTIKVKGGQPSKNYVNSN